MTRSDGSLCDQVVQLDSKRNPMVGSTDVGNVSWVVPTVRAHCSTYAIGTPGHSLQLTAQGKIPAAKKGMVHVPKVMAATAVQAIENKTLEYHRGCSCQRAGVRGETVGVGS